MTLPPAVDDDDLEDSVPPATSERSDSTTTCPRHTVSMHHIEMYGYDPNWPLARKHMGKVFNMKSFDAILGCCILTNMALLVIETDKEAAEQVVPGWVGTVNLSLMFVYCIELTGRLFVYRWAYFQNAANWADICIVGTDVLFFMLTSFVDPGDIPSVVILRIFRLARLGRARQILNLFPELNVMVLGLVGACRAIFWGMLLLMVCLMAWGILAVQLLHPLNKEVTADGKHAGCERCGRAFESVAAAGLTFTQSVIAGDSWGLVAIPLIERYPITYVFFFLVFITVGMAVLNLILAVVIDSANQARKQTDHEIAAVKEENFEKAKKDLSRFCHDVDIDKDGMVTLEELEAGYHTVPAFADAMKVLDVKPKDIKNLFRIMDQDKSGDVNSEEFVEFFYAMKCEDQHSMITLIKYYVTEIQREMKEELLVTRNLLFEIRTHFGMEEIPYKSVDTGSSDINIKRQSERVATHDLGSKRKDSAGPQRQTTPPGKPLQRQMTAGFDFTRLQLSQDKLDQMMQDVARDLRSHGIILASLSEASLTRDPLCTGSYAVPSSSLLCMSNELPKAPSREPKAGPSLAVYPPSKAGSTTATNLHADSDGSILGCCSAQNSSANPPVSLVPAYAS